MEWMESRSSSSCNCALFAFFATAISRIAPFSNGFNAFCNSYSMKTEEEVVAYIAEELHIPPIELVIPEFVCATCFNLLRESFFGGILPHLL